MTLEPDRPNRANRLFILARAGKVAMRPRSGECVWLDRPMTRPGERRNDGTATFIIRMLRGLVSVQVNNQAGRTSWQFVSDNTPLARRARHIWNFNTSRYRTFCFGARRIGKGRYDGRLFPTTYPATSSPHLRWYWHRLCTGY